MIVIVVQSPTGITILVLLLNTPSRAAKSSSSKIEDILPFLQRHFLHWVEAMSLLGLVSEVEGMLGLLYTLTLLSNLVGSHVRVN